VTLAWAARLARIRPAHVGAGGGIFTPDFSERWTRAVVHFAFGGPSEATLRARKAGDHHDAGLKKALSKPSVRKVEREIEKDAFVAHLLQLRVGGLVTVLDGIGGRRQSLFGCCECQLRGRPTLRCARVRFFNRLPRAQGTVRFSSAADLDHVDIFEIHSGVPPPARGSAPSMNRNS